MSRAKLITIAVLVTLLVIVIFQNSQDVETRLLWMQITMPRALLLMVMLLVGFGLGVLFGGRLRRKV